jgi:hypothetical protein
MVKTLSKATDATFEEHPTNSDVPVLVDYWWNSWTLIAYGAILEEVAD